MDVVGLAALPRVSGRSGASHEDVQWSFLEVVGTLADSREVEVNLELRVISAEDADMISTALQHHVKMENLDVDADIYFTRTEADKFWQLQAILAKAGRAGTPLPRPGDQAIFEAYDKYKGKSKIRSNCLVLVKNRHTFLVLA